MLGAVRSLPVWVRNKLLFAAGVGMGGAVGIGLLIAGVSLLSSAESEEEQATLVQAFEAYDAEDLAGARKLATKLYDQKQIPLREMGGLLYVLGAVTAGDAETESDDARRRQLYRVAARYLEQARDNGFPPDRRADGLYLLGRCLIESEQFAQSLPALREALEQHPHKGSELQRLLATACFRDTPPQFEQALGHLDQHLADRTLAAPERHDALLEKARIQFSQPDLPGMRATLDQVPDDSSLRSEKLVLTGRMLMREGDLLTADVPAAQEKFAAAIKTLRLAEGADSAPLGATPQAEYLLGVAYRKRGELSAAEMQLDRTASLRHDSAEGLAALLEAAEVKRELGKHDEAVADYRKLLSGVGRPEGYHNRWVPLEELRRRVQDAYAWYRSSGRFELSVEIAQACWPLLPRDRSVELEAQAYRAWGDRLLEQARNTTPRQAEEVDRDGWARLRDAGRAYARVARMRRAARSYPDQLWNSALAFLDGHDFQRAVLMLDALLESVSNARRPEALVALGQAYLSLDRSGDALPPLLECIERFPTHPQAYRARLLAARVYLELDKLPDNALAHLPRAKALLDDNLHNEMLTPRRVEWRDSLFELGRVLYREGIALEEQARRQGLDGENPEKARQALESFEGSHVAFASAVEKLDEAARRYPETPQAVEARDLLADAYRHAADHAERRHRLSAIEATHLALEQQTHQQLQAAAQAFERLIADLNRLSGQRDLSEVELGILRNAYFGKAASLLEQQNYDEALTAYSAAADRFRDRPEALEALVQVSLCQRQLGDLELARGSLERARATLDRLPQDIDFTQTTRYDRAAWIDLLDWLIAQYAKIEGRA